MALSVRMSQEEEKLIKEFATTYNVSVSSLIRTAVLEKIEDEIDIDLYDKAMAEHLKKWLQNQGWNLDQVQSTV